MRRCLVPLSIRLFWVCSLNRRNFAGDIYPGCPEDRSSFIARRAGESYNQIMNAKSSDTAREPAVVFTSWRDDEMALAKSMLRSAGIPYFVANERLINVIGDGRIGGSNQVTGPMRMLVPAPDAEDATAILDSFKGNNEVGAGFDTPQDHKPLVRVLVWLLLISLAIGLLPGLFYALGYAMNLIMQVAYGF